VRRRFARAAAVLLALSMCACGTAQSPRQPPARPPLPATESESLAALAEALERVDRDLAHSFEAAADCDRACLFVGHICTLAERICAIAGRHPDDAPARERCRDARERCRRAHERAAARCRCPAPPL
jgi:hypothetical protein